MVAAPQPSLHCQNGVTLGPPVASHPFGIAMRGPSQHGVFQKTGGNPVRSGYPHQVGTSVGPGRGQQFLQVGNAAAEQYRNHGVDDNAGPLACWRVMRHRTGVRRVPYQQFRMTSPCDGHRCTPHDAAVGSDFTLGSIDGVRCHRRRDLVLQLIDGLSGGPTHPPPIQEAPGDQPGRETLNQALLLPAALRPVPRDCAGSSSIGFDSSEGRISLTPFGLALFYSSL